MLRLGIILRFYGSNDTLRLAELLGGYSDPDVPGHL